MKNIHFIPTDKPSRLYEFGGEIILTDEPTSAFRNHDIYITNDEEIKDWYYLPKENKVAKCTKHLKLSSVTPEWTQKIILTTDQDLINRGVQAIDDEFLEWFVKNPNSDSIQVNPYCPKLTCFFKDCNISCQELRYKLEISKEEPKQIDEKGRPRTYWGGLEETKQEYQSECICDTECRGFVNVKCKNSKQETLEDICNRIEFINPRERVAYYNGLQNGAKWQAEMMYSEEEVINILVKATNLIIKEVQSEMKTRFKQNNNK